MRVNRYDRAWVWTPGMVVAVVGSLLGVAAAFTAWALSRGNMAVFWSSAGLGLLSSIVYHVTWDSQKKSDERLRKHSWVERLIVWGGYTVVGAYCSLVLFFAIPLALFEMLP